MSDYATAEGISWGPAYQPVSPDILTSNEEKSRGFQLDGSTNYAEPGVLGRRSLLTVMRALWSRLRNEPLFYGVDFTRDYPQSLNNAPRVIWRLTSRQAGVEGKNRKAPFLAETWPMEDGTIVQKWVWPQTIQISIQSFETTPELVDELNGNLEFFLTTNPIVWSQSGACHFQFVSESGHEQFQLGGSQPLDKRTLNFLGVINYIYTTVVNRLTSIKVQTLSENLTIHTVAVSRSADTSTFNDIFPVQGPLALAYLHENADQPTEDFLPGVDYELLINSKEFGQTFYINWTRRGKRPNPGATYYATYITVDAANTLPPVVLTELQTDPNTNQPNKWRNGVVRSPILPRVLGQEIDATRGKRITFFQQDGTTQIAGIAASVREALNRAQVEVATILDTSRL